MPKGIYKHNKLSEITKKKLKFSHLGKKHSKETKIKIGLAGKGKHWKLSSQQRKKRKGKNHWNWQGGVNKEHCSLRSQIEALFEYRQWRSDIFTKDNWTCQECLVRGGNLHAHHIKYFSVIIEEYNIKNIEKAIQCSELWNINNGITLCQKCHKEIHKKNV